MRTKPNGLEGAPDGTKEKVWSFSDCSSRVLPPCPRGNDHEKLPTLLLPEHAVLLKLTWPFSKTFLCHHQDPDGKGR